MAIFTSIAAAIGLTGFFATAFVTVASIATSIGLSYVARALAGDPNQDAPASKVQGVQGTLQSGADVPRSFNIGYSVTGGSLVYANTWGQSGDTPNAYLTQVIAIADLPGGTIEEVWVNGELCTLGALDATLGYAVTEYNKDGADHLWVKYHDGTQTTADAFLTGTVASVDRPYESTRVGVGVAHVVVTSLVNDTLFTGFPTFKWGLSGIPLYDPTKDSTNGGTGSHRWSDPSTWGGDGDDFPAVQAYNILRGIYYDGVWLYGLQLMTAARLPAVNWNAQIAKCRATVTGVDGAEPTYRTGGQISVNAQIVHTIEALLTGCQGRLSEIGGFYKIHLGTPDSPSFSWTDDDILSTEEQNFAPFFGLADSVNGIQLTYPDPAQGWNMTPAPPLYSPDHEAEDGGRRLLASPVADFVPYPAQAQRLQKSALQEARRARRHSLVLPPPFWIVEPGDVGEWTSTRNGYTAKQFRADGVTDKANLDVLFNFTEVDPTDYDWTHATDFVPGTIGPTVLPRPAPQGVVDWFAEAYTLLDTAGQPRRPAILLSWDGNMPGVVGVQYEVRLASSAVVVTRGRTDQLSTGAIVVSQSLIPNTEYEARGQYLPSAPRDMLWSDWLAVTTPDVSVTLADFDLALKQQVTTIQDALSDRLDEIEQRFATLTSAARSQNWIDKKEVRSQLYATAGEASAEIATLQQAMVDADTAFAAYQVEVSATFGPNFSSVATVSAAVATLDGYAAAQWAVTTNVDGHISGINLINGGSGLSEFTIEADKIKFVSPGVNGGLPVPFLTAGTVNGVASVGVAADFFLDGTLHARAIEAGTITALEIAADAIDASKIAAGSITTTEIAVNGVDLLNIVAGAATKIYSAAYGGSTANTLNACSVSGTIVSGTCIVILSDNGGAGAGGEHQYTLKVDGVNKSPTYPVYSGGNGAYASTLQWVVGGLSNGSHTFTIGIGVPAGSFLSIGGVITVIELRR